MLFKLLSICWLLILPQERMADRVVAIVNDEPILYSELNQTMPTSMSNSDRFPALMRTNLEALIDQTLILQEIKRLKLFSVEPDEVDAALDQMTARYGSAQNLLSAILEAGMSLAELRAGILRKLLIMKFIDYRFRQVAAVEEADVIDYYNDELLSEFRLKNPGLVPPGLESQRRAIEAVLRERVINTALENWLEQTRSSARIVIKY